MPSPLENLSGPGKLLRQEAFDAKEFAGLLESALVRLTDAEKPSNSLASRFDLAYNAADALCLAALRRSGYRSTNRYIVFQVLILPLQARIEAVTDEGDLEEVYDTERHLLYVACTRARDHLLVTSVAPGPEFLDDFQRARP